MLLRRSQTMSKQQPSPRPTFYHLLRETMRILSTHRRHFLVLFLLFFLLRFLLVTAIYLQSANIHPKSPTAALIILALIPGTLSLILSLIAVGTIMLTSYNFLLGRPVKLASSMQSLLRSFPRLLITSLIKHVVIFAFKELTGVILMIGLWLFKIDQSSLYVTRINTVVLWIKTIVLFYININWALSSVIVLIESKWGLEPLRRSIQLIQGMRPSLGWMLLFNDVILWGFSYSMKQVNGDSKSLLFDLSVAAVNTGVSTVLMVVFSVASTVLYCKAVQGELTGEYSTVLPILIDDDDHIQRSQTISKSQLPTFYYLLCETTRIVSSNRRHFLILSLLFILPNSLFDTIYSEWSLLHPKSPTTVSIIASIIYVTLSYIISFLAIGPITFSSYNFLLGRPTKLITSSHSLLRSFPGLLTTCLPFLLISFLFLFASALRAGLIMVIESFWFKIDQSSPYFTMTNEIVYLIGLAVVLYLHLNLALSSAIVVIETKQGLEPMRRSIQLMQGVRRALVSLAFFNEAVSSSLSYGFSYLIKQDKDDAMSSLLYVLRIAVDTGISVVSTLVYIIAPTVLYCKAVQRGGEYVSLPLVENDEKTCKVDSHVMPSSEFEMA